MTPENDLKEAVEKFYKALNEIFTGSNSLMKEVWSHADDINYMGPMGEMFIGWQDILKVWDEQAALKLGGKIEPQNINYVFGTDLAATHNYEIGENTNVHGKTEKVSIRVTNLFRKEDGVWKMIGHHTDILPNLV